MLNIYRGSQKKPSIFGVTSCSPLDWIGLAVFMTFCCLMTSYSVMSQQKEQALKIKYGEGLMISEIPLNGLPLLKLLFFAFVGGWISGALGMGGGSIFNPLLLSFGVPPQVSSATGMYMIIFSTGASTMTYVLNDMLDISYGIWAGSFCIVGAIIGMQLLDLLMKRVQRQSPQVFLLCFILSISAVAVPFFGISQLKGKKDILRFHNLCPQ